MWTHLERQAGGQVKGMGEKQIEVDKRILRTQVSLNLYIIVYIFVLISLGCMGRHPNYFGIKAILIAMFLKNQKDWSW